MSETSEPNQARFVVNRDAVARILEIKQQRGSAFPKFAVFIVAYNAAEHLVSVLKRIPTEIYDLLFRLLKEK